MLVSANLRNKLAALEAAGKIKGEVVIVPVANQIGGIQLLSRPPHGPLRGPIPRRISTRNFHDLSALVQPVIEARLTDNIDQNRKGIRTAMR